MEDVTTGAIPRRYMGTPRRFVRSGFGGGIICCGGVVGVVFGVTVIAMLEQELFGYSVPRSPLSLVPKPSFPSQSSAINASSFTAA